MPRLRQADQKTAHAYGQVLLRLYGIPCLRLQVVDEPTGEKCPQCGSALVKTARGTIRCSNKECSYRVRPPKPDKPAEPGNAAQA